MGLGKKVILANNLSTIVDTFFKTGDLASLSVVGTWYTVIVYAMQVYFDFSGYSDIAIGLGRIFGFHFDENFRYPFVSKNITEFWQRWHILSSDSASRERRLAALSETFKCLGKVGKLIGSLVFPNSNHKTKNAVRLI